MNSSPLKAVLFDLDDTLYEEAEFFRSGFDVVSRSLAQRGVGRHPETAHLLLHLHQHEGRDQVFQKLAARLGFPTEWIADLVEIFRAHVPHLVVPADTAAVLPRLRARFRLGCITDGWAAVQRRKIEALHLAPLLDAIVIADEFGREYWKPHAFPFHHCCTRLGVTPGEALFVGDNPSRDAVGAANAGIRFVRLRRPGSHFEALASDAPGCHIWGEAANLYELEQLLTEKTHEEGVGGNKSPRG